jgi:rhodanese-related sulfurtransferase
MKTLFRAIAILALSLSSLFAGEHRTIIDAAAAKQMHERGAKFVDVRSKLSFEHGHIPGALNIDVRSDDFVERFTDAADVDEEIVIYCRGATCTRSGEAILLVHPLGYNHLFYLKVGLPGWEDAGYPVNR